MSLTPYARALSLRHAEDRGLLHPARGPDRRHRATPACKRSHTRTRSRTAAARPSNGKTGGWLGITDKYWAAALIPDQKAPYTRQLLGADAEAAEPAGVLPGRLSAPAAVTVAGRPDGRRRGAAVRRRQAGEDRARPTRQSLGIQQFDLLIDWGWFYFITKPLFHLHRLALRGILGNFGLAILATTVLVQGARSSRSPTRATSRWPR